MLADASAPNGAKPSTGAILTEKSDLFFQNGRRDPVVSRGTSGFRVVLEQFALVYHVYLENRPCSPWYFNH